MIRQKTLESLNKEQGGVDGVVHFMGEMKQNLEMLKSHHNEATPSHKLARTVSSLQCYSAYLSHGSVASWTKHHEKLNQRYRVVADYNYVVYFLISMFFCLLVNSFCT